MAKKAGRRKGEQPAPREGEEPPFELECGACGRKGKYLVGRLMYDPEAGDKKGAATQDEAFGFTRYIRCKHCDAGGPWHLTTTSKLRLFALLATTVMKHENPSFVVGAMQLFDKTIVRWPTQGEEHLKRLIEKDPGNYFLWSRLGNVYKAGDVPDLALSAYSKAIELNEHDVESYHSMAEIHLEREENETAAGYLHLVLAHARHAPARTPRDLLRDLVRDSLKSLACLHLESNQRIPLQPPPEMLAKVEPALLEARTKPLTLVLKEFDLSRPADIERMVDMWMPRERPVPQAPLARPPMLLRPEPQSRRVGRNDPCPCGSGKKFKNCCMRAQEG